MNALFSKIIEPKHRDTDENGYSLIELLTVIAIIGILATIAIPTYHGYRDKARMTTIYSALRQYRLAQEVYFTDYSKYYGGEDGPIVREGPVSLEFGDSGVEIYIPNQQTWALSFEDDSVTNAKDYTYRYSVLIQTNMDRDQKGELIIINISKKLTAVAQQLKSPS